MPKLVLLRHGQSEWNQSNRFNGWIDTYLSATGKKQAQDAGRALAQQGIHFSRAYSSVLSRTIMTINRILDELGQPYIPLTKSWRLNERHYGILQGEDKDDMRAKYGKEQVQTWRRSYFVLPPKQPAYDPTVTIDGRIYPAFDRRYARLPYGLLPLRENIHSTEVRVQPLFEEEIMPRLHAGENVLVVAHGTSVRALTKLIEGLTPDQVTKVEIPNGEPIIYEFDKSLSVYKKKVVRTFVE